MPAPKPTKAERAAAKAQQKQALQDYRRAQSALAVYRDNNQCIFCWFLLGVSTPRSDVHHVYGRGRHAGDRREHHSSLACTCRKHHPLPIQTPGGSPGLAWVEECLARANSEPINRKFRHPAGGFHAD